MQQIDPKCADPRGIAPFAPPSIFPIPFASAALICSSGRSGFSFSVAAMNFATEELCGAEAMRWKSCAVGWRGRSACW